jgi:alkylated DNA nucleotide flippase Atl1
MPPILRAATYELDFDVLYARMWEIAISDRGDATRLYAPAPGEALKWLIAELAGTPAESGRTMPENDAIRREAHRVLEDEGWAERLSETRFRLLRLPVQTDEFAALHTLMSVIPAGRWTTYGDLGSLVDVHSRGLGSHIKNCPRCPNAVRVLTSSGQRHGSGFRWSNPDRNEDANDVLEREGVRFENGRAAAEQYLPAPELVRLWAARQDQEDSFDWPTIEWAKVPIDRESEEPNGSPIRMRHFLDCPHWYRDADGRLLGEPPLLATDDQMRSLPACQTCVVKAESANNPARGPRMTAEPLASTSAPKLSRFPTPSDITTDGVALVAVRREQRFLRQHLLRAATPAAAPRRGTHHTTIHAERSRAPRLHLGRDAGVHAWL